jgi:hypothetical protein
VDEDTTLLVGNGIGLNISFIHINLACQSTKTLQREGFWKTEVKGIVAFCCSLPHLSSSEQREIARRFCHQRVGVELVPNIN